MKPTPIRHLPSRIRPLAIAVATCFTLPAYANPVNPQVVSGTASFAQQGNVLTVTNSANAIINWQQFSIGAGETTRFIQPSELSSVLNRVVSSDPSVLLGNLQSNGKVFLINPAGILVGSSARIDVAGFVASTLNLSDSDFLAGRLNFTGNAGAGKVENHGLIQTPTGGSVYLVAPQVENHGIIQTPGGEAILAAGQTVQLVDTATPGVTVEITGSDNQATNVGQILADSGRVGMVGALVRQAGTVSASSVVREGGEVFLRATRSMETTADSTISADGTKGGKVTLITRDNGQITGELTAKGSLSAQGDGSAGSGGFVETSAAKVDINNVEVKTNGGEWLIDPVDFTIAASGGDMTGAQLSTSLASNSVTIYSTNGTINGNGDLFVNDSVSWSANKLTLNAQRNIEINANLYGSGTAQLALEYGQANLASGNTAVYTIASGVAINLPAGDNFSTKLGYDGVTDLYKVITSLGSFGSVSGTDLQGMNGNLSGKYVLGADIDASDTASWDGGAGFSPVGTEPLGTRFTGRFDGLGHTISDLTINRPSTNFVGLFGYVGTEASIQNIGIINAAIVGYSDVGALVGVNAGGDIANAYSTGSVSGKGLLGGLVGESGTWDYTGGGITNSHSSATVSVITPTSGGEGGFVGGLVGNNAYGSTVSKSYATGSVSGLNSIGGLAGQNNQGFIVSSYASGSVNASGSEIGGLVGINHGNITDSYAIGSVVGNDRVGGLVGNNSSSGSISNTYATGSVTGTLTTVGGLVAYNEGTVLSSFWDMTTTGQSAGIYTDFGVTGGLGALSSSSAFMQGAYGDFDFDTVWWMSEGNTRPFLRSEYSTSITNAHQLQLMALNTSATYRLANSISLAELSQASGLWNIATGFAPVGDYILPFYGSFDGQGHTISGLTINRPTADNVGLFGYASGAKIARVGLLGGSVTGYQSVGGLVGTTDNGTTLSFVSSTGSVSGSMGDIGGLVGWNSLSTIDNSYFAGDVTGTGTASAIGGLAGMSQNSTITNSYNTGTVYGYSYVGGLVGALESLGYNSTIQNSYNAGIVNGSYQYTGGLTGYNYGGYVTIYNSYNEGNVTGYESVGGISGWNTNNATISTSYSTGPVSGTHKVGGLVGTNDAGSWGGIGISYSTGNVTGTDYVGGLVGKNGGLITDSHSANTVTGSSYVGGLAGENLATGSIEGNSYSSSTVSGSNMLIGGLIGLNYGTVSDSYSLGSVSGSQHVGGLIGGNDGGAITNSHSEANVYGGLYVGGLIGTNSSSATVTGSYSIGDVTGTSRVGGLVGQNMAGATINGGSYSSGNVSGSYGVGGLVGYNAGTITDTSSSSNVTAIMGGESANEIGGLVGANEGTISYSTSSGIVDGSTFTNDIGGLTGTNYGTIDNSSHTTGAVTGRGDVGGLAGFNDGTISNSFSSGAVSGSYDVGGLIGSNWGYITTSSSSANVTAIASYGTANSIGGLAGSNYGGNIEYSSSSGSINGGTFANDVGGLVGHNNGSILGSYSTSSVTGNANIGGLVGYNANSIANSYSMGGTISGESSVGGIAGYNEGNIYYTYNESTVSGSGTSYGVGGLVGVSNNSVTISNSYNVGAVSGNTNVGGLVGESRGSIIEYSYNTGLVSGTTTTGGLIGFDNIAANGFGSTATNSFWDTTSSGQASSASGLGTGLSSADMKLGASFSGWDFGSTWVIYDGYTNPLLRSFMTPLTVTATSVSTYYDGMNYSGGSGVTYSVAPDARLMGSVTFGGSAQGARNAGTYTLSATGLYSNQQGYLIDYVDGTLTINQMAVTISTSDVTKTYDGTTSAAGSAVASFLGAGDTLSGGSFAFTDANAGTNKTVTVSSVTINDGNGGNNYIVTVVDNTTSTINPAPLTVTATDASKTYDATAYSGGNSVTYAGFVNGENAAVLSGSLIYGGSAQGATNAGTYLITPSSLSSSNYDITYIDGTLTINPAALTVSTSAVTKTYDGTTSAVGSAVITAGSLYGTDTLSGGTFAFTDANAGTGKTVTVASGVTLSDGNGGNNYIVTYADNTASTINQAALTVTASSATKTYDATAYSGGNGVAYSGFVNGETATVLGGTLAYGGTAQGATNAGSYALSAGGLTSGNYAITYVDGALTINPAALTVSTSAVTKTYDGTTSAVGSAVITAGSLYGTDTLSGGTFAFTDANAGTGKTVTVASGVTLSDGNGGNNYIVTYADNTASTINQAALTVTASSATKTYDAAAYSGGAGVTYSGFVNSETSTVLGGTPVYGGTAQGARNAGSYTLSASGLTSGNYAITYVDGALTINPAALTVSTSAVTKTYDGTTSAAGSATITAGSLYGSDTLSGGTFAFTDANAGTGKTVTVSGITLSDGNGGGNYTVTLADNTTSVINPAALTVTASSATKTYDATAYSGGNGVAYSGFVNGETATVLGGTLAYGGTAQGATNAGSYALSAGGLTSGNYAITYVDGALTINPAALTVSTSAVTKTYDGTTSAAGSAVITAGSLYGSDTLSGGTFAFTDANAGTGKTVTVSGVTLSDGNGGGNYAITYADNTASVINQAALTITGMSATNKVYDGTTAATLVGGTLSGLVGSETLSFSGQTGTFTDKNAGVGKAVTVSGIALADGTGLASNYTLVTPTGLSADITPRTLSASIVGTPTKTYDGTTAAALGSGNFSLSNLVAGESFTVTQTAGSYNSKDVLSASTVSASLSGSDFSAGAGTLASNYILPATASGSGAITPATLSVALTGGTVSKVYDATAQASLSGAYAISGIIGSDNVDVSFGSASYDNKNVGTNKLVTVSGLSLMGVDAGNYSLSTSTLASAIGTITPLAQTTWTGAAGDNLWSNAGNWQNGILPETGNVLSAAISSGVGSVIYNDTVSLDSVSSDRPFALIGGTLTTNTFTASQGYTQTGGTLIAPLVSLASSSAISQTGGIIKADNLTATAVGGIDLKGDNRIAEFSASNTGSGDINFVNTYSGARIGELSNTGGSISIDNTGALETVGKIFAAYAFNGITHSPFTVGSPGITAGDGGISITADLPVGDIILNGSLVATGPITLNSMGGGIAMAAGTQPATITSGNSNVTLLAANDMSLTQIDAGTGDVSLTSSAGSVLPTMGFTGTNVIANHLTISVGGSALLPDVNVNSLTMIDLTPDTTYAVVNDAQGQVTNSLTSTTSNPVPEVVATITSTPTSSSTYPSGTGGETIGGTTGAFGGDASNSGTGSSNDKKKDGNTADSSSNSGAGQNNNKKPQNSQQPINQCLAAG